MFDSVWPHRQQPTRLPIPGILQARTLQWVAISFSNAWKWKVKVKSLSHAPLLATPWTAAYQAPLSMGFSRQEYWSGVPLPSLWGNPSGRKNLCVEEGPPTTTLGLWIWQLALVWPCRTCFGIGRDMHAQENGALSSLSLQIQQRVSLRNSFLPASLMEGI